MNGVFGGDTASEMQREEGNNNLVRHLDFSTELIILSCNFLFFQCSLSIGVPLA